SAAVTVFFTGIVFLFGSDSFGYLPLGETPPWIPGVIGLAISAVLLGFAVKNKIQFRPLVQSMLMVGGMALLCFSPWMVRNLVANGQLGIGQLLESPFPTPEIIIEDKAVDFSELLTNLIAGKAQERGVVLTSNQKIQISNWLDEKEITAYESLDRQALLKFLRDEVVTGEQVLELKKIRLDKGSLPPDSRRADEEVGDDSNGVISASELAKREEIQRYLGYESGLPLYATLPYDLTMNTNILKSQYVDLGFLFLILFPIFLLRKKENKYIVQNLVVIVISLFLLLVGVWTVEQQESFATLKEQLLLNSVPAYEGYANGLWAAVNNSILTLAKPFSPLFQLLSGIGFAGVFVSLLILGGALIWIVRGHWSLENYRLKYAFLFVLSFGGLWLLLGSGIPWYGFPIFVGLMIYLVFAAVKSGFELKSVQSWAIGVSFLGYSLLGFSLVFISSLQAPRNAGLIYQEPVLRSFGEGLNQTETLSSFKPYLGEAINYINQNPADKIYRVGTFFNYHIAFNDRRVLEDNQLGKYDEFMRSLDGDEDAFMDLLKANGFRYILFDMNTASLDRTPE
ncbi:MAG: hypothetical protein HRU12_21400, partial [Phaeodactylibacter sp.]|nr:hypothetical protein [Phaeodactylibacter sp.]